MFPCAMEVVQGQFAECRLCGGSTAKYKCAACLGKVDHKAEERRLKLGQDIFMAALAGDANLMRALLSKGADPNFVVVSGPNKGYFPMYAAAQGGHVQCLELLYASGADPNQAQDITNVSAIYVASSLNKVSSVRSLVSKGANVNFEDSSGCTPLHAACKKGWVEMAGFLIVSGAQVNHISRDGITALLMAAMHGHIECVCMLLCSGANVHHKMLNVSALDLASNAKKTNVAELLKTFMAIHPAPN